MIPTIQKPTLVTIYIPPKAAWWFSIREKASSENVEKVVKPPHNPVFQNSTAFGEISSRLLTSPTIKPIRTAPRRFVISVRTGKPVFTGIKLIAYLPIAPIAPPRATKRKLIRHHLKSRLAGISCHTRKIE